MCAKLNMLLIKYDTTKEGDRDVEIINEKKETDIHEINKHNYKRNYTSYAFNLL